MATGTEARRQRRNDIRLTSTWGMTEDMEEVASEWAQDSTDDRLSYAVAWDQYAGTVNSLKHEYYGGELTSEQERDFLALVKRLFELRPLFKRMNLRWPEIDELEILGSTTARDGEL